MRIAEVPVLSVWELGESSKKYLLPGRTYCTEMFRQKKVSGAMIGTPAYT
jgi:hypothetical protein